MTYVEMFRPLEALDMLELAEVVGLEAEDALEEEDQE